MNWHRTITFSGAIATLLLAALATTAHAQNYPCSGSKGGVFH